MQIKLAYGDTGSLLHSLAGLQQQLVTTMRQIGSSSSLVTNASRGISMGN
jgi:hypothetical protein